MLNLFKILFLFTIFINKISKNQLINSQKNKLVFINYENYTIEQHLMIVTQS